MKIARVFIFTCLIVWSPELVYAQHGDKILNDFSGFEVNGVVYLSATIASGNTCNGIDILKSADNYNFQHIGDISGICGSTSNSVQYEFIDSLPILNGINYYKLELGGQGYTTSIKIDVRSFSAEKVQIYPNPMQEIGVIRFSNPDNHVLQIEIYNSLGQVVLNGSSKSESLDVYSNNWTQGMYWVRVYNLESKRLQSGVFMKI